MSFSTGFKKCKKCGKLLFGLFDGELCDECEKAEQNPIEKITLWGGEQFVSIETYQQVCKERDIAIEQLHELGYEFGQKIEPCDDVVSRESVKELIKSGISTDTYEDIELVCKWVDEMPPVRPQELTREEQTLLRKWRDNRGISMEEFSEALDALQEPQESEE